MWGWTPPRWTELWPPWRLRCHWNQTSRCPLTWTNTFISWWMLCTQKQLLCIVSLSHRSFSVSLCDASAEMDDSYWCKQCKGSKPEQVGSPDDGQVPGVHVGLWGIRGHSDKMAHQKLQSPNGEEVKCKLKLNHFPVISSSHDQIKLCINFSNFLHWWLWWLLKSRRRGHVINLHLCQIYAKSEANSLLITHFFCSHSYKNIKPVYKSQSPIT